MFEIGVNGLAEIAADLAHLDVGGLDWHAETPDAVQRTCDLLAAAVRRLSAARVDGLGDLASRGVQNDPFAGARPEAPESGSEDGRPEDAPPLPPPPPPAPPSKQERDEAWVAGHLRDLPFTREAFQASRLTLEQVLAMVRYAINPKLRDHYLDHEGALVQSIVEGGPAKTRDLLEQWKNKVAIKQGNQDAKARFAERDVRTWTDKNGMGHAHFTSAGDQWARFLADFERAVAADPTHSSAPEHANADTRTFAQRKADVFAAMMEAGVAGRSKAKNPLPAINMLVGIDYDDLVSGAGAIDLISGVPLSGEAVRRLCCDAGISRLVTKGKSLVLDKGTTTRLAAASQRAALAQIYDTCMRPGCTVPFRDCQIHHFDDVIGEDGETNINEMGPACYVDHHFLHEGGHDVEISADGDHTWVTPDGLRFPIQRRATPPPGRRPPDPPTDDTDRPATSARQLLLV